MTCKTSDRRGLRFTTTAAPVITPNQSLDCIYLNSRLRQVYFHGDLLAGVNVRIVSLLEGALQLLQLGRRECRSYPPLFPLLRQHCIVAWVDFVRQSRCEGTEYKSRVSKGTLMVGLQRKFVLITAKGQGAGRYIY